MSLGVNFKIDTTRLTRLFDGVQARQIPFATSAALNATIFDIQRAENAEPAKVFKHPRPFSSKAFAVIKSAKSSLRASVFLKSDHTYIEPYVLGGEHIIPGNQGLRVPGALRVDQYGQITRPAFNNLVALAGTKGSNVFFGEVAGITGWWLRPAPAKAGRQTGKGNGPTTKPKLKLLLRFEDNVEVTGHFPFLQVAQKIATENFEGYFHEAFAKAMRTAKR